MKNHKKQMFMWFTLRFYGEIFSKAIRALNNNHWILKNEKNASAALSKCR
jgi:hypothetical protein